MKFEMWGRLENEIAGFKMKCHTIYYKMKFHYYILLLFFIDFLYNL